MNTKVRKEHTWCEIRKYEIRKYGNTKIRMQKTNEYESTKRTYMVRPLPARGQYVTLGY